MCRLRPRLSVGAIPETTLTSRKRAASCDTDNVSLFEQLEALLSPLIASDLGVSAAEGPEQLQAIQDLLAEAEDPQAGFDWLGERIATLPPTAGSWVGVYLGGLVERGRLKGAVSAPGVLAFFRGAVEALSKDAEHPEWNALSLIHI